eukprot:UN00240
MAMFSLFTFQIQDILRIGRLTFWLEMIKR